MAKQLDYHTIREIFTRFQAADPEPKGELDHVNVYTLVVAVALSAQATDAGVNKATNALFKVADTPQKMVRLKVQKIESIIKPCGLSPRKAKAISELSKILLAEHDAEVPADFEKLEALPGVGHKTASVVMAQAFGHLLL